ncbi:MAG TPA: hypothetical protein VFV67_05195 [Actinophytocola sp.]|uniref:hypothetical protein n=1 Tax=Actinophytocola sp. TaxID=1872138 RepID=UPI002DB9AD0E|nr:hypothetical protein [Actinophytocola sp.]HEU5470028.1 hypothetical protein [Actinophytocola sp.]
MEHLELTRVLRSATADLEPRPGFAAEVVRGGRRRRTRNRITVAALVILTALAGAGIWVQWQNLPASTVADPRMAEPTRGDLATDPDLLATAVREWRSGLSRSWNARLGVFDDLRGAPHVYWAGRTPAGPAAVVMQQTILHPNPARGSADAGELRTLAGLVAMDPMDRNLKLVTDQFAPDAGYFQFGPADRTVLVVARDGPVYFSAGPIADGSRTWTGLAFAEGVSVVQAPEGTHPAAVRVVARADPPAPDDDHPDGQLPLKPATNYLEYAATSGRFTADAPAMRDNRLPWGGPLRLMRLHEHGPVLTDLDARFIDAIGQAGLTDPGAKTTLFGRWRVATGLPDGRSAIVGEVQIGDNRSRIYAVLLRPDDTVDWIVTGDWVDPTAELPVLVKLPDGQGWIAAKQGSYLTYRVNRTETWTQPAGGGPDAVLIPATGRQVRIGDGPEIDLRR